MFTGSSKQSAPVNIRSFVSILCHWQPREPEGKNLESVKLTLYTSPGIWSLIDGLMTTWSRLTAEPLN